MGSVEPRIPSCCNNLFADVLGQIPRGNQDESRTRRIHDGSQNERNQEVTVLRLVKSWVLEVRKVSTSDLAECERLEILGVTFVVVRMNEEKGMQQKRSRARVRAFSTLQLPSSFAIDAAERRIFLPMFGFTESCAPRRV